MKRIDAEVVGDFWPLGGKVVSGGQFVAGKTLEQWQAKLCVEGASMAENAWVGSEDWGKLVGVSDGAVLVNEAGERLAWTGDGSGPGILVGASSFLVLYPWDIIRVNEQIVGGLEEEVTLGEVSAAAHIEGVVHVGEGTRILPGVFIEGNAVIGAGCKIGPNCYIRGNTAIGDGVHIGQAVEVKNSVIGHGSSVGHLSYVGDSVLGDKVNFGAATVTSNLRHDGCNHRSLVAGRLMETGRRKFGTIVGDGVHTGIHTAIYPGRKLGAGTSTRPNESVETDKLD
ncbi:hypothetical protein ACFSW8_08065 [Rubritalea tangerina]|uniref:Mannose-1-phosphate guanyltransferase C-terminal domain-containing protein n=2 Tax=Rubritalea tangerina TaxID=430798 RepID=A0ABW4ZB11_9BACT